MAKLVMDYYEGADLYSDGAVEARIYEAVINKRELLDMCEYVDEADYYAFLYHLSPIRENILNWYPFSQNCKILEVGSGCGAITGLLCKKAAHVTSIELSKARADINYERHKDVDNLEIIVGNFNRVELEADYDYVVVNGVLEYAASFIEGERPYHTFLDKLNRYLKPTGTLLVAIENRLGAKYFSGALEDHTDKCFLGISDYPGVDGVKTFSKVELSELLMQSGYQCLQYYYPYPDYKFPIEIYTDDNINAGSYGRNFAGFEKMHRRLFDEHIFEKALMDEQIMDRFANSFLVEARKTRHKDAQRVIYAKLNSARREKFAIGTIIKNSRFHKKSVVKFALNVQARDHIYQLHKNSEMKSFFLKGKLSEDGVVYPFVKDMTLADKIGIYTRNADMEGVITLIQDVFENVLDKGEEKKDIYSLHFRELFGDRRVENTFVCINNANIDLIADNIFCKDKEYIVVDCEWCLNVDVPVKFIKWRFLNEMFQQNTYFNSQQRQQYVLERFDISAREVDLYREWANYFAQNYVADERLVKYQKLTEALDVTDYLRDIHTVSTDIYVDVGFGFSEENKACCDIRISKNDEFLAVFDLSQWDVIKAIRWDPIDGEVVKCENIEIRIDGECVPVKAVNDVENVSGLFMTTDPQFLCCDVNRKCQEMRIFGKMIRLREPEKLISVYDASVAERRDKI